MQTKTFAITDMFCAQCETRIASALRAVDGVSSARASLKDGNAIVSFDFPCTEDSIVQAITRLGYTVAADSVSNNLVNGISILVIIFGLWYIVNSFGLTSVFQKFPVATSGMSYAMLFAIGFLTSFHCIAMCGGLHFAGILGKASAAKPALLYNFGRLTSYTVLGGLLGLVGSVIAVTLKTRAVIGLVAAVVMLFMGIRLMNCFPFLKKIGLPRLRKKMPAFSNAFAVGLANGFMPCGPLQTMQLIAIASGTAVGGALSLFFFCLGTMPLLVTFGIVAGALGKKAKNTMALIGGTLIVVFAVAMLQNNLALLGVNLSARVSAQNITLMETIVTDGTQSITTPVQSGAYQSFSAKKGIPLVWHISVDEGVLNGCNNEIIIPDYNLSVRLHSGDNVVEFTPEKAGIINYSCWMGMIRAQIVVTE